MIGQVGDGNVAQLLLFNEVNKWFLLFIDMSNKVAKVGVGVSQVARQRDEGSSVLKPKTVDFQCRSFVAEFALSLQISALDQLQHEVL